MSWGSSEFAAENRYDSAMATARIVYFAAAGDGPGTLYPCTSPYAVCVGGTTKCGTVCVDTKKDPANCGACGTVCPSGQVCTASVCTLTPIPTDSQPAALEARRA
jgi:subtilase family serine protease